MNRYCLTAALTLTFASGARTDDAKPVPFEPTEVCKIRGHTSAVVCVAFSSDGKLLATASRDKTVRIWDAKTGACKERISNQEEAYCVAFSPDGKRIAVGSYGGAVNVFEVTGGEKLKTIETPQSVAMIAWSPAGDTLAVAAVGASDVTLLDPRTEKVMHTLAGKPRWWTRAMTFSPDGKSLVTANDDSTIRRFDTGTGKEVDSLKAHDGPVMSVAYSRDGKYLVTGGYDGTIVRWDIDSGNIVKPVMELPRDERRGFVRVGVLPNGRVWGRTMGGGNAVFDAGTGNVLSGNSGAGAVFYGRTYFSNFCALSLDGKTIAVASEDDVILWDAAKEFGAAKKRD